MPGFANIIPQGLWRPDKKEEVIEHLRKIRLSESSTPDVAALFAEWARFIGVKTSTEDFEQLTKPAGSE